MSRRTRRSLLAAAGTALASGLAGCNALTSSGGETVEYDDDAIDGLPGELPEAPAMVPVQPAAAHVADARERVRSLLRDADPAAIPNEAVRRELAREAESARDAIDPDDGEPRVGDLAALTHPRSEAMFAHAGLAAFDDELTPAGVADRRERHRREAESFLDGYRHVGPPGEPIAAFAQHARIADWAHTGARIVRRDDRHEYRNTVLHVAELAQDVEWGRAYAADARRLHERYTATLDDPREYGDRFATVAGTLVGEVDDFAEPDSRTPPTAGIDRDLSDTPAETLLSELAAERWLAAGSAVERRENGRHVGAIVPAMRALAADGALDRARDAIADGAYDRPASVEPVAAERTAAVDALRALIDSSPTLLAARLVPYARRRIRNADGYADEGPGGAAHFVEDFYPEYAAANRFAAAAPAVVDRVGGLFEG